MRTSAISILLTLAVRIALAQTVAPPAPITAPGFDLLEIAPSSAALAGGQAHLLVHPLKRTGATYTGDYQLKVTPYFFKSEKGDIAIVFSEESLRQIVSGKPVKFTGTSTSKPSGKIRAINGVATPSAKDAGALTFSIKTDNGVLMFTSTYKGRVK